MINACVVFSHLICDNLLHNNRKLIDFQWLSDLRVKSQVISTIWALATLSNLIFLHFCHCTMAYKFIKYDSFTTGSGPSNILSGMLFPDFCSAHSSPSSGTHLKITVLETPSLKKKTGIPNPTQHALLTSDCFNFSTAFTFHHLICVYSFICL